MVGAVAASESVTAHAQTQRSAGGAGGDAPTQHRDAACGVELEKGLCPLLAPGQVHLHAAAAV